MLTPLDFSLASISTYFIKKRKTVKWLDKPTIPPARAKQKGIVQSYLPWKTQLSSESFNCSKSAVFAASVVVTSTAGLSGTSCMSAFGQATVDTWFCNTKSQTRWLLIPWNVKSVKLSIWKKRKWWQWLHVSDFICTCHMVYTLLKHVGLSVGLTGSFSAF